MAAWLVIGASGMLGTDLVLALKGAERDVTAWDLPDLDITDLDEVLAKVSDYDVVVNCAAWTAVDAAEEKEGAAFAVNALGPQNLALAVGRTGGTLVQISTDYVFNGTSTAPYLHDAPLDPQTAYGRTKAAGEWAVRANCPQHYIVRTAYLYGEHGPNLVNTFARFAVERDSITAVTDQHIQPTWTLDLAAAIGRLVDGAAPYGVWHGTSTGATTVFELARAVCADLGQDPDKVGPTTLAALAGRTPRPAYSVLSHERWERHGLAALPDWRDALTRYLAQRMNR